MNNQELSIYDNAKYWVSQYEAVDDVKDFVDKAAALQEYARRSNDMQMEIKAAKARVRAERRCGVLLNEAEMAKGGNPTGSNQYISKEEPVNPHDQFHKKDKPKTLKQYGIKKNQSAKYKKLAQVPEKVFEERLNLPGSIPSSADILKEDEPEKEDKKVNVNSIYLCGDLRRFKEKFLDKNLNHLLSDMLPKDREETDRLIPEVRNWLNEV